MAAVERATPLAAPLDSQATGQEEAVGPWHLTTSPRTRGTSGWMGSDASRARARADDEDGTTRERHEKLMAVMAPAKSRGRTWFEIG